MGRYLAGRLIQTVLSMLAMTVLVFLLARVVGDPTALLLPVEATPAQIEQTRREIGLDRPLLEQYAVFMTNMAHGNFGNSFRWRQPALELVLTRLPATARLAAAAVALALLIGLPFGILSAVCRDSWLDRVGYTFAMLGQAAPTFWIGLLLIIVFAVRLRWLPAGGARTPESILLPAITLGWYLAAVITRLTRSAMLDVLDAEYIAVARLKGLPERLVILRHALRNALIPIVTVASLQFATLLGGSVITEQVFAWPGVGQTVVEAIFARDYPVVQTAILVTAALFITINLLVDLAYAWLDPRIRYS